MIGKRSTKSTQVDHLSSRWTPSYVYEGKVSPICSFWSGSITIANMVTDYSPPGLHAWGVQSWLSAGITWTSVESLCVSLGHGNFSSAKPSHSRMKNTNSLSGTSGAMVNRAACVSMPWFSNPCVLLWSTKHHTEISGILQVWHPEGQNHNYSENCSCTDHMGLPLEVHPCVQRPQLFWTRQSSLVILWASSGFCRNQTGKSNRGMMVTITVHPLSFNGDTNSHYPISDVIIGFHLLDWLECSFRDFLHWWVLPTGPETKMRLLQLLNISVPNVQY